MCSMFQDMRDLMERNSVFVEMLAMVELARQEAEAHLGQNSLLADGLIE